MPTTTFFALASITMPSPYGEPVVAVHGQVMHHQSHLFQPTTAKHAAFAQFYFYDVAEAAKQRAQFGDGLDEGHLAQLDTMRSNMGTSHLKMTIFSSRNNRLNEYLMLPRTSDASICHH